MARRLEHQAILEKNNSMIRELRERAQHIELRQKQLLQSMNQIRMNAYTGCGSECLRDHQDQRPAIFSGALHKLGEAAKGGAGSIVKDNDKNKKPDLNDYYESM